MEDMIDAAGHHVTPRQIVSQTDAKLGQTVRFFREPGDPGVDALAARVKRAGVEAGIEVTVVATWPQSVAFRSGAGRVRRGPRPPHHERAHRLLRFSGVLGSNHFLLRVDPVLPSGNVYTVCT